VDVAGIGAKAALTSLETRAVNMDPRDITSLRELINVLRNRESSGFWTGCHNMTWDMGGLHDRELNN